MFPECLMQILEVFAFKQLIKKNSFRTPIHALGTPEVTEMDASKVKILPSYEVTLRLKIAKCAYRTSASQGLFWS